MNEMGLTPKAISMKLGRSHHTVQKYLQSEVFMDPAVQKLVDKIRDRELDDLYLLGAKARKNLHDMLDKGKGGMIPTTAVMDRAFQQRRLLEGLSTSNLKSLTAIVLAAHAEPDQAENKEGKKPEGAQE